MALHHLTENSQLDHVTCLCRRVAHPVDRGAEHLGLVVYRFTLDRRAEHCSPVIRRCTCNRQCIGGLQELWKYFIKLEYFIFSALFVVDQVCIPFSKKHIVDEIQVY